MEVVDLVAKPAKQFSAECSRVLKACQLPSIKVLRKTATMSFAGFLVLGSLGFAFKLVSLPINNVIIGGMVNH